MNGFEQISKLGEGAYSIVLKVRRLADNNIYALKKVKLLKLSEKEKQNALNEVRILASVKSNFVISYKEAFFEERESSLGIVMEYADKGDLYQRICEYKKRQMMFEESEIWRIFIQLVKGLKALHELKILHRDLKSANVFLFSDGSAKLGDLNVSKVAKKGLGYTQTGTPYYASPEVWNDKPYNYKSDIWSLGCVLYEMIMLRPPFRAESMEGLYNKVIKGQYPRISDRFSNDLSSVVGLLIRVDPNARPSCEQILNLNVIQKRIEYFKTFGGEDVSEDQALLQTINIPKNLLFLGDKLPSPNYEKSKKNYNSFSHQTGKQLLLERDEKMRKNNTVHEKKEDALPEINAKINNQENSNKNSKEETKEEEKDNGNHLSSPRNKNEKTSKPDSPIKNKSNSNNVFQKEKSVNYSPVKTKPNEEEKANNSKNINNHNNYRNVNNINISHKKINLPELRNNYELPIINHVNLNIKKHYINNRNSHNYKNYKIIESQNNQQQRINNLYKLYAPSLQRSIPVKYPRYMINSNNNSNNSALYIQSIDNNNNYYKMYKPERQNKIKKLSPIKGRIINIY